MKTKHLIKMLLDKKSFGMASDSFRRYFFYIFLFSFLLAHKVTIAQELVFVSYDLVLNAGDTTRVGHLDLEDCSSLTLGLGLGNQLYTSDITLDSDSIYYRFKPLGWTSSGDNLLTSLEFDPYFTGAGEEHFNESYEGMTCDRMGNLYLAGEKITRWKDGIINVLGDLPPSMYCRGDLTFRKGKLYLSTVQHTLVEVDLDNPMNSSVVMNFPPNIPEIHGLATIDTGCDSVETYAAASEFMNGTTIYRIDFNTFTLEEVCQYDFYVTGLATYDECSFPDCLLNVDLDQDNSSLASGVNDFQAGYNTCSFPLAIADEDVNIFSEFAELDSIQISLINPAGIEEYLSLSGVFNLDVSGNISTTISLLNNGNTTIQDLEFAIEQIQYHNEATVLVNGLREIELVAHFGPHQSSIATAFIPIDITDFDPGFIIDSIVCTGDADAAIWTMPDGGLAPYDLAWSINQSGSQISNLDTGLYFISITDALACMDIDTVLITEPDPLYGLISNPGFDTICDDAGTLMAIVNGGTPPYTYHWNNGSQNEVLTSITGGNYTVTIEDANACQTIESYDLFEGTDVLIDVNLSACYGENIVIDNQIYLSDTSFCKSYLLDNGCDSLRCYQISFFEEHWTMLADTICHGDSLFIFGHYFSTDTLLYQVLTDINACDSLIAFSLEVDDPILIDFDTSGNLCSTGAVAITVNAFSDYAWSNGSTEATTIAQSEGVYEVTVYDDHTCSARSSISIEAPILQVFWQANDPSCNGEADGLIQIDSIEGGAGPYLIRLNNEAFGEKYFYDDLAAGIYTLEVEDVNTCKGQASITLNEPMHLYIDSDTTIHLGLGESTNIILSTNAIEPKLSWQPSDFLTCDTCLTNTITPQSSITYTVRLSDTNDCSITHIIDISVDQRSRLFIPNVFSPNDDGTNDVFKIYGDASIAQILELQIRNRWGDIVYVDKDFLPDDSQIGWDAYFKNQKAAAGVYLVYIEYVNILGQIKSEAATLTLLR